MIEGLQLRFHSPTPGDLRSSSLTFPLWCPAKGCAGDVALLPSHDMSDPFPSSSHNDGTHIVLVSGQNIRRILLRFLVWKVDSLLRSLSVILQHSEPYNKVEITQLWYSLNLSLMLYWDDFQTLFNILNAFLALLRRFLMSLPAPPSCLTVLPRYVNSSVVVRSSPFTVTGSGFDTFSIITSVFFWLIFKPSCCAKVLRRDVFSCMCWWMCDMSAKSSAKSRSSSCVKRVHLMPRAWSAVVCLITQSIVKLKSIADIQQPCLTPVFTLKLISLFLTLHEKLL